MGKEIKSPFIENKNKDPRFTEGEIELLKKLDDETLRMFRCVFYQDELDEQQLAKLKSVLNVDLVNVIRRFFDHSLNWKEPLFGMPNRWNIPKFDQLLVAEVPIVVKGRQMAIRFLDEGMKRLEELSVGGTGRPRKLEFDIRMKTPVVGTNEEIKERVVAMQDSVAFLESALQAIHIYTMNPEDLKDMVERIKKDSAR